MAILDEIKIFAPIISATHHLRDALADTSIPVIFAPFSAVSRDYIASQQRCLVCDWSMGMFDWDQDIPISLSLRAAATFDTTGQWIEQMPAVLTSLITNYKNNDERDKIRFVDADAFASPAERLAFLLTGVFPASIQALFNGEWGDGLPDVMYGDPPRACGMRAIASPIAVQVTREQSPYEATWTIIYSYLDPYHQKGSFLP